MAKQEATSTNTPLLGVTSHIGGRPNLEDRAAAETLTTAGGLTLTLAMVADGIGGNVQGERAAELAIQTVFQEVRAATANNAAQLPLVLAQALQAANAAVFEEGRVDRSRRGMGTTAVVVAICGNQLYLANVGDSRAYLIRGGHAAQITRDHTWAFEMQRQRLLTEAEIAKHPKRHELVRSIGYGSNVDVDLGVYLNDPLQAEREATINQGLLLQPNDRLVLCSDGLIKEQREGAGPFVTGDEMTQIVGRAAPQAAAEALVARAVGRRADDNVTAVVVETAGSQRAVALPGWLPYGLGGLVLLLAIGALAIFLLRPNGEPPAATAAVATEVTSAPAGPTPTLPVPVAGQVNVIAAGSARWEAGEASGSLSPGTPVDLPEGQAVRIVNDAGITQLGLPDGGQLYLDGGAEVELMAAGGTTAIDLRTGRVLAQSTGSQLSITALDAAATLPGPGVLGVLLDTTLLRTVTCVVGSCNVRGEQDSAPMLLPAGQMSIVSGRGTAGLPEPADTAPYALLAPGLVPTPTATATVTETPTATPTNTPAPRATIRPTLTPIPTMTRPPLTSATSTPEPPTPSDEQPTTKPPAPTDTPPEPATPEPQPTTPPED